MMPGRHEKNIEIQGAVPAVNDKVLLFALDYPHYGLPVSFVERVIRAVEITPLPRAPEVISGVINVGGRIIPVIEMRVRLHLPKSEANPDDRFIIARTSTRVVVLAVNRVLGIRDFPVGKIASAENALPFAEYLGGITQLEEGLVLIYDLDRFLSLDEEVALDSALSEGKA